MDNEFLEGLAQALGGGRRKPRNPEERNRQAQETFNSLLSAALDGNCPGALDDPTHAAADEAALAFLKAIVVNTGVVPEPVFEAVLRVAAMKMTHMGNPGKTLTALMEGELADGLVYAGATLRVIEAASKNGVSVTTGQYL